MGKIENDTPEMTGCLTIDHKARIQDFDANCERLFGFKRSEVINRNVSLLMPTAYALEHDAYLTRYLCGGEPRIIGCGCEIIAQRKDGLIFPIWLTIHEDSTAEQPRFIGHITAISA